jgi:hypothetical protein
MEINFYSLRVWNRAFVRNFVASFEDNDLKFGTHFLNDFEITNSVGKVKSIFENFQFSFKTIPLIFQFSLFFQLLELMKSRSAKSISQQDNHQNPVPVQTNANSSDNLVASD